MYSLADKTHPPLRPTVSLKNKVWLYVVETGREHASTGVPGTCEVDACYDRGIPFFGEDGF